MEAILGAGAFQFPKDSEVISDLIGMVAEPGDIVLDSFGGSGTTAHAVLRRNQHLKTPMSFILVELDEVVALTKTQERVRKAIEGYTPMTGKKRTPRPGLGGGFQFCRLSTEPLFTAEGQIRHDVTFGELAEFVWFAENGTGYTGQSDSPFLGVYEGRAVYLLYNGILKDRSDLGGNVLNNRTLAILPPHDGPRIVYGARCRFDTARLKTMGIEFKQLPYELAVKSWI